ncbi:MAG: YceD family protein [Spiribacter sp.]|jgi:uncharacterized protein|nr:YceD family protein [Spiribacter sp.]MDR9489233.1 YceD family protein [Spiribacter sp.]
MQAADLPAQINLNRLGREARAYNGVISANNMQRLAELVGQVGIISAQLQIDDCAEKPRLTGECEARVELICERCLEPVSVDLHGELDALIIDRPEEVESIPMDQAVIIAPRGELDVTTLLEDELILALPVVPRHDDTECDGGQRHFGPPGEPLRQPDSPFTELNALKTSKRSEH